MGLLIFVLAILYIILFRYNIPESHPYPINLMLSGFFTLSLLLLSFIYGNRKKYMVSVSIIFGIALLSLVIGIIFRDSNSIWKWLLAFPCVLCIIPFSPILSYCNHILNDTILMVMMLPTIYGLIFLSHQLGKKFIKER